MSINGTEGHVKLTPVLVLFAHWNDVRRRYNALPDGDEHSPEWAEYCAFSDVIESAADVGPADLACKFLTNGGIDVQSWFADKCRASVKVSLPDIDLR